MENVASHVLSGMTERILQLAESKFSSHTQLNAQQLDGKKQLIDGTLQVMKNDLTKLEGLMKDLEKDRVQKFGQLESKLAATAQATQSLQLTAENLRNALSANNVRGQWGERMAEDVLRHVGMVEGVNYYKKERLPSGKTPDFTFPLPQKLELNMDVKFPFSNYQSYLDAKSDAEKEICKKKFLRDVRSRITEIQGREYINENTVDYVLLFIPNEQIYSFINVEDHALLDEALKKKTILCSPLTLYAVLSVIREAMNNFSLEKKSKELLSVFGKFRKEWFSFKQAIIEMGDKINTSQKFFEEKLAGVRLRQLEKPVEKMESMRLEGGISIDEDILPASLEFTEVNSSEVESSKQVIKI